MYRRNYFYATSKRGFYLLGYHENDLGWLCARRIDNVWYKFREPQQIWEYDKRATQSYMMDYITTEEATAVMLMCQGLIPEP